MRRKLISLFTVPLLAFAAAAYADEGEPQDEYLSRCQVTPAISASSSDYPGRESIIRSGKMALPAGKSLWAAGQIMFLSGRVLDENCVPVSDAVVELWHTNPGGKYVVASGGDRANPYPTFAGTGRAVTNNLGVYRFVTVFPGTYDNGAPHLHVRVAHTQFSPLFTEIFFRDDLRNGNDGKLMSLRPALRERLLADVWPRDPRDSANDPQAAEGLNAALDITLKGKNKYRRF